MGRYLKLEKILIFFTQFTIKMSECLQHMPRTAAFTLENLARKTECIFEKYMVRGTFWRKNRNRTYSRF